MDDINSLNDETRLAWDANAEPWDAKMGDAGNEFINLLCWPVIDAYLEVEPTGRYLDVACGNGILSRRVAAQGGEVTAFDFSAELIERARAYQTDGEAAIQYYALDATDEPALISTLSAHAPFEAAFSNMALFDIAEIEPLFRTLPKLLKPGGAFIFSIVHPAFNNPSTALMAEEWDDGEIHTRYAVKVARYITPFHARGNALRNQPQPQWYFHRPLSYYFEMGFEHGFIVDGFEERAFPPDTQQVATLGWGGKFSEIPPVVVIRMRLNK